MEHLHCWHQLLVIHLPCGDASRNQSHHWLIVFGFIQTWLQLQCLPQRLDRPNHEAFPIDVSDLCSRSAGFFSDKIAFCQCRARSWLTKMTGESNRSKGSIHLNIRSPSCISKGYSACFYRQLLLTAAAEANWPIKIRASTTRYCTLCRHKGLPHTTDLQSAQGRVTQFEKAFQWGSRNAQVFNTDPRPRP